MVQIEELAACGARGTDGDTKLNLLKRRLVSNHVLFLSASNTHVEQAVRLDLSPDIFVSLTTARPTYIPVVDITLMEVWRLLHLHHTSYCNKCHPLLSHAPVLCFISHCFSCHIVKYFLGDGSLFPLSSVNNFCCSRWWLGTRLTRFSQGTIHTLWEVGKHPEDLEMQRGEDTQTLTSPNLRLELRTLQL